MLLLLMLTIRSHSSPSWTPPLQGLSMVLGPQATHVSNIRVGTPFFIAPEVRHVSAACARSIAGTLNSMHTLDTHTAQLCSGVLM